MPRTVHDTRLETRAVRERLKLNHEPYWRSIDSGAHIGYRKGKRAGSWIARYRPDGGRYSKRVLGKADDTQEADGVTVLTFQQAQQRARDWFGKKAREGGAFPDVAQYESTYKIRDAIRDYLEWLETDGKSQYGARRQAEAHILPDFGDTLLAYLTTEKLRKWQRKLATTPPRVRSGLGREQQYREIGDDPDASRKRKATANRIWTTFRAALNHAFSESKVMSADAWRKVRPFKDVDSATVRYLAENECVRLVNACKPVFRNLVRAALLSGCRYGELTALKVSDYNPDSGTLIIRTSKTGKSRHAFLTDEGRTFFDRVAVGRDGDDSMFLRADGKTWKKSQQQRPLLAACKAARIHPPVSFHMLRHTHASLLAMRRTPMGVIAVQLGHSDTRITERHYAHLSPSYVAITIRANLPVMGIVEPDNVETFKAKR